VKGTPAPRGAGRIVPAQGVREAMSEIVVGAQRRSLTGKNVNRRLRAEGRIPGVLYGSHKEPVAVAVSPQDIAAILQSAAGENTLFDLDVEGDRRKVILKQFQVEPVKGSLLHADFFEVALDKPIEVRVHIELEGTPVGVKAQGGHLEFITRELEIECLPTKIPDRLPVDVSALELGRNFRVSDMILPDGVTVLTDPDVVVAHVVMPRAEAAPEAEAPAEAAPAEGPEVIKKGKTTEGEVEDKGKDKDKDKDKKEKK
jgi:large subunit ribosomal protein L25